MKLLFISTNACASGAPKVVHALVKGLKDKSYDISVAFGDNGPIKNEIEIYGIKTYLIPNLKSSLNIFNDILCTINIYRLINKIQPDLIHVHSSKAALVGRIANVINKIPIIYTVHGWGCGKGRNILISTCVFLSEFLCKYITNYYVTVSNFDKSYGINKLKIKDNKISTIHNGVDDLGFNFCSQKNQNLVMVARNDEQKDYLTLIKSLDSINFNEIFFIGKSTNTENFKSLAKIHCKKNYHKIKFVGESQNIKSYLNKSSLFLLISHFEGLPLSIIEAMSVGLPIIASDVGGVSELVKDSYNGYLIPPKDHKKIAYTTNRLLKDNKLKKSFSDNSRKIYQNNFMANEMLMKYNTLYNKI